MSTKTFIYGNIFNACALSASLLIAEWLKTKGPPKERLGDTASLAEFVFTVMSLTEGSKQGGIFNPN